jgi:hypothetical protein
MRFTQKWLLAVNELPFGSFLLRNILIYQGKIQVKIRLTSRVLVCFISVLMFSPPFDILSQQESEAGDASAVLLIGDHRGIDEVDARSAALLIALELRKLGVSVSDPVYEALTSANVYRVSFNRLGEKILVHLSQETPVGAIVIERQLWIANIEEMIEAAPRLVDALIHKKPIASTVDVENVIEEDTPVSRKITGESLWTMGLFGTSIPGTNLNAELGFEVGLSYERPTYAVETEFRFTGGEEPGGDRFIFSSWSIGGRYFFNKQNISPYVGGGLSLVSANYDTVIAQHGREWFSGESESYDDYNSEEDSGLGAYVIGGVEILRLSTNRLKLELRVDRPLFSLPNQDVMPVSIGLFYSRHYIPGVSGCCLF